MKSKLLVASVIVALAGCSSAPVDNAPVAATAVLKADYVLNGALLPDGHGSEAIYTRLDRQLNTDKFEADAWMMRQLLGKLHANRIARLDKNVLWEVFPEDKSYTECPLKGCQSVLPKAFTTGAKQDDGANTAPDANACPTTVTKRRFEVVSTPESRDVNGFRAKQNTLIWSVTVEDSAKRSMETALTVDLWTTDPSAPMSDALKTMADYNAAYVKAAYRDAGGLERYIPGELARFLLDKLTGGLDSPETKRTLEQLAAIKGLAISKKVELRMTGTVCEETVAAKQDTGVDYTDPQKALKQLAGGFIKKKVEEKVIPGKDEPVFRYIYDVKSLSVESVRDSEFDVPAGYKLMDRK